MIVLGISTSSKYPSAAVSAGTDGDLSILSFRIEERPGVSHSETLMSLIDGALSDAGVPKNQLEAVAVDVGPGSFTGVRIGVSCANAIAFALGIPVLPVYSLNALCAEHGDGPCAALIDCRNGNCYAAVFDNGSVITPPCAAVTREILDSLPAGCAVYGDVFEKSVGAYPDAVQVLIEASKANTASVAQTAPMYLRPSQAERMKKD